MKQQEAQTIPWNGIAVTETRQFVHQMAAYFIFRLTCKPDDHLHSQTSTTVVHCLRVAICLFIYSERMNGLIGLWVNNRVKTSISAPHVRNRSVYAFTQFVRWSTCPRLRPSVRSLVRRGISTIFRRARTSSADVQRPQRAATTKLNARSSQLTRRSIARRMSTGHVSVKSWK